MTIGEEDVAVFHRMLGRDQGDEVIALWATPKGRTYWTVSARMHGTYRDYVISDRTASALIRASKLKEVSL